MNEELDLDALQRLADAATPGPWTWEGDLSVEEATLEPLVIRVSGMHTEGYIYISPADAEFIAAARSAVPALLDRVRELEAELEARIEDRDYWYRIATEAKDQRDAALSTIAKVEALHQPYLKTYDGSDMYCKECNFKVPMRNVVWPCPTARALGSVPSTGEGDDGDD